jgi:hypothetical protein
LGARRTKIRIFPALIAVNSKHSFYSAPPSTKPRSTASWKIPLLWLTTAAGER